MCDKLRTFVVDKLSKARRHGRTHEGLAHISNNTKVSGGLLFEEHPLLSIDVCLAADKGW